MSDNAVRARLRDASTIDDDVSALFEAAAAGLRMSPGDEAFTHLQSHALVRS